MSQPSEYADGEAVWVKWGSHWWPGEVWSESRVPEDVKSSLRKPPIFFVKFFQEEAFEFVRSQNNIMRYNCDKKMDFIRKGMDKHKSNMKIMENFPADVVKAEKLTGGNVNILATLDTPSKQKPNASPVTQNKPEMSTPILSKKATGAYNSVTKVQVASPAPKDDKKFSCPMCNFSTDRMNLLMFHIKNHSNVRQSVSEPSTPEVKKFSSPKKKNDDSIADDVRKIKNAIEKKEKEPKVKKSREPKVMAATTTPVAARTSRSNKKEEKIEKVEEKPKPVVSELKKELLADWSDDDDGDVNMEPEKKKVEELPPPPKPMPPAEKVGESSRSIRNIPKKQRLSEVIIHPEPVKVEPEVQPEPPKIVQPEVPKKLSQKAGAKRKAVEDDSLLLATADLLNETEVPKVEAAQLPSPTFHKSNDIDKRNLPPKERNKRIFRDNNNGTSKEEEPAPISSPIQNELMLPHKKKQSSRLLTTQTVTPVQSHRKKRGSGGEVENSHETEPVKPQSPLREEKLQEIEVKSPEVKEKSPEVVINSPEIKAKSPEVTKRSPEVTKRSSETYKRSGKTPEVREIEKEVLLETPEVVTKTSEIVIKAPKTPEKAPEVTITVPEVLNNTPEVSTTTQEVVSKSPEKSYKTPVKTNKSREVKNNTPEVTINSPEVSNSTPEVINKIHEIPSNSQEVSTNTPEVPSPEVPVRTPEVFSKTQEVPSKILESPSKSPEVTNSTSRRGQKRRNSKDSHQASLEDPESCSEPKKLHKAEPETPKTIVACASEAICITSKGELAFARRDSLKTTLSNSVMVTSQVIITEGTRQPIVTEATRQPTISSEATRQPVTSDSVYQPKPTIKIPKNALKFPAEKLVEMKKQGLVKVGLDNKNKLTEKGKQIFKESQVSAPPPEPEQTKTPEPVEPAQNEPEVEEEEPEVEPVEKVEESTNNNDETINPDPVENGKEPEGDSGGLIALQAETFGGPPNCFYLCRQIEDRYEPVDNQILVLNAQNALVPYEGDIVTDTATEIGTAGYPQLSPNSNIIINTPNGQKIELNHFMIMALQEQADENGIASIELSGEQLELNINGILEAINQQQDATEGDTLIPGAMLIDGDSALILDTSDLPVEIHHSATQVSETLTKPIMSTTVAPEIPAKATISETVSKNLNLEDSLASIGVTTQPTRSNVPKSLELPITVTNPTIAETVNHRKLANAPAILGDIIDVAAVVPETFVLQSADNGSED